MIANPENTTLLSLVECVQGWRMISFLCASVHVCARACVCVCSIVCAPERGTTRISRLYSRIQTHTHACTHEHRRTEEDQLKDLEKIVEVCGVTSDEAVNLYCSQGFNLEAAISFALSGSKNEGTIELLMQITGMDSSEAKEYLAVPKAIADFI